MINPHVLSIDMRARQNFLHRNMLMPGLGM